MDCAGYPGAVPPMYQHGPDYRFGHAIFLARLHCRQPAAALRDVAHRLIVLLDRRSSVSVIICVEERPGLNCRFADADAWENARRGL